MLTGMATPWPITPMKAVSATAMPTGGDWVYEPKWDGHRVLARRRGPRFDAVSSTGKPKDPQWPWLETVVNGSTDHDVILDGEVIAYADDGRHSFQLVGSREHRHAYVVFDILSVDGKECLGRPWTERRELLLATVTPGDRLSITPVSDDAEAIEAATRAQRFEGVIAKRPGSTYQPGRRSPSWVKVKYRYEQEMVIGGYKLGEGNRVGSFGSLLVGVHDAAGDLQFVSAVGTGLQRQDAAGDHEGAAGEGDRCVPVRRAAEAAAGIVPVGPPRARRPGRVPRVDRRWRPPSPGLPRPA